MTFNDWLIGIVGKSMHKLYKKLKINDVKSLKCVIPISLRKLPTGYHDLKVWVETTAIDVTIPLSDSVEKCMKEVKPITTQLLDPKLLSQMINIETLIYLYTCRYLALQSYKEIEGEDDLLISNIPVSQKPYSINGKKFRKFRFFNNCLFGDKLGIYV